MVINAVVTKTRAVVDYLCVPVEAREESHRDRYRGLGRDPGIETSVAECIAWLRRAQDNSTTRDGGVARHFSLTGGWGPSYPETTGYIIPTLVTLGLRQGDEELLKRAKRMLDWLVSIQFPEGGFQGGTIHSRPIVPVTFNTGQILLGLVSGTAAFGKAYEAAMCRAAEWLVNSQDHDGCWRKHPTPFAAPGEKAYETHAAWGLLEAASISGETKFADAAIRNLHWALTKQQKNGWFADCCLTDPSQPLTHTLGYALRGLLEAYRHTNDTALLVAACLTGAGLVSALAPNGFLPGRLDACWKGTVSWACLTGTVQVAHCWLLLFQYTSDSSFREAALAANRYVRRTIRLEGGPETRGAIKGSFPIFGDYGRYQYLSWAAKFFVDSNLLERD